MKRTSLATTLTMLCFTAAFAVEVEPTRLELTIPADEPTQSTLQITNPGSRSVQVRLSAEGYRSFDPALHPPSAQTWLTFNPDQFTLAAGATSRIGLEITPPDNVSQDTAGEYLAAILVDEWPMEEAGNQKPTSTITVVPRFAMPVYLKIDGRQRLEAEIGQVSIRRSNHSPKPLLSVETTLLNRGTVHIRPTGTLGFFASTGSFREAHPLGKSVPLLPGGSLSIPTVIPMPPAGQYKAVVTVDVESGGLLQKEIPFEITSEGQVLS